jgi:hypothetical protein
VIVTPAVEAPDRPKVWILNEGADAIIDEQVLDIY